MWAWECEASAKFANSLEGLDCSLVPNQNLILKKEYLRITQAAEHVHEHYNIRDTHSNIF